MLLADDHLNIHNILGKQTKLAATTNTNQLEPITQNHSFSYYGNIFSFLRTTLALDLPAAE